ncbi:MAG TPA: Ig-like domain-containing protein, partial [Gemmatimonadales bacterium]|nr:Ig-like domain-containing protein [Gemmatimonadales bacterium]
SRFDNLVLPAPLPARVVVAPDTIRLAQRGATQPLAAIVYDASGEQMPWARVRWSSSDTAVAAVDAIGVVTARRNGTALVIASSGTAADTARVAVGRAIPPRRRR